MSTIAEMMIAKGLDNSTQVPDYAGSMAKGAELGIHVAQVQNQREQLEQQKQDMRNKKIQEMTDDLQKVKNIPGGKALQGYKTFLNNKAMTYKVDDVFDKDTIDMITASPENLERFTVIRDDVLNGRKTLEDAVASLKNPAEFYDVTPNMLGDLYAASETRVKANEAMNRAQVVQQGSAQRQATQIASVPETEYKKKISDQAAAYNAAGAREGLNKNVKAYRDAIEQLRTGDVKLGGVLANIPYGADEGVLARLNPKAKALIDNVRGGINMRAALADPNPTEKQINMIMSRTIDPRLSNAENIKKLEASVTAMEQEAAAKEEEFKSIGLYRAPKSGPKKQPPPPIDAQKKSAIQSLPKEEKDKFLKGFIEKYDISLEEAKSKLGL